MTKKIKKQQPEGSDRNTPVRLPASWRNEGPSDKDIGKRLRIARESASMTQATAAEKINMSRTTLVSMEQGLRRASIKELQKLAMLYQTSANAILRSEAVHINLVPRFRKLKGSASNDVDKAAELLNTLASAETELENVLGINRTRRYPPECPILPGDIDEQAERNAQDLRYWLGMKSGPIPDILSLLDQQLGIRLYVRRLEESKISGLFAYEESVGACVLLNAKHPVDRLRQSAAHELGHFYSTRGKAEVLTENENFRSREERYASRFARAFLTPAQGVAESFAKITAGQSHFTRRHAILLAHENRVSREAMIRRLEELHLIRKGAWEWFESNGGITNEQAEEVLGSLPPNHLDVSVCGHIVPPRIALLAREAWKRGFYSEGQLARRLDIDRIDVREILARAEQEEENNLFKLPN